MSKFERAVAAVRGREWLMGELSMTPPAGKVVALHG